MGIRFENHLKSNMLSKIETFYNVQARLKSIKKLRITKNVTTMAVFNLRRIVSFHTIIMLPLSYIL